MGKWKKRLFLALIFVLLLVPALYYVNSGFFGRKDRVQREGLLVRRQVSKPLQPAQGEGEEQLTPFPLTTPREDTDTAVVGPSGEGGVSEPAPGEISIPQTSKGDGREARLKELEATIRRLEKQLLEKEGKIGDWKRRWEEKSRELEGYIRELMALKKEPIHGERKPSVQRPPVGKEVIKKPDGKEKRVVRLLRAATLAECEGVPMSHRNLAFFLCRGLRLGSDLSYSQAVTALNGVGISPRAGWNQGDPSFPIGAGELEEILSKAQKAISIGLVAGDYPELTEGLRQYCKGERVHLVEAPQCEGPMVSECGDCEISQGDFAIYLCKVLGIGEALNYDQSFLALAALNISPRRGWRLHEPFTPITKRQMEEIRCSVREAYKKGLISTEPTLVVASVNDLCLWLKMDVEVVGLGTVVETITPLSGYHGGGGEDVGEDVASSPL